MKERRKYVRLNIPLQVSYVIKGKEDVTHNSIVKNISPGGARFAIGQELPKGTILDIEVKIPASPQPIPIKAKVIWSKKELAGKEGSFDAGFEFIQVSEASKNLFFQYLCNLMCDQMKDMR